MNGWKGIDGWMDGDGWMWRDRWMDGWINRSLFVTNTLQHREINFFYCAVMRNEKCKHSLCFLAVM